MNKDKNKQWFPGRDPSKPLMKTMQQQFKEKITENQEAIVRLASLINNLTDQVGSLLEFQVTMRAELEQTKAGECNHCDHCGGHND